MRSHVGMARLTARRHLYESPDAQALLQAAQSELPAAMGTWLSRLCLLYGVPFNLLLPDSRMLPRESLRFFNLDLNWVDALVDGALSLGAQTSQDLRHTQVMRGVVRRQADWGALTERARLQGALLTRHGITPPPMPEAPIPQAGTPGPWTGFLLRSALVSGWPGLEVKAYADAAGTQPLPALRLENVAPDLLFGLFDGVVRRLDLAEPGEGLQFGVEDPLSGSDYQIALRGLGIAGTPYQAGEQIPDQYLAVQYRQGGGARVLDVTKMVGLFQTTLNQAGALPSGSSLTSAQFAIQMVKMPERQSFAPAKEEQDGL